MSVSSVDCLQEDATQWQQRYCVLCGPKKDAVPKRFVYYPDKEAFQSRVGRYNGINMEAAIKVEKGGGGVDTSLGFTLTFDDATKKYFLSRSKSERNNWMIDLKTMVAYAKEAIARGHRVGVSYPIPNPGSDSYTEGKLHC